MEKEKMARFINRFGKRQTLYASTMTEISRKLRDERFYDDNELNVADSTIMLDEWYEKWIKTCKTHCRDTTKRTYQIQYNRLSPLIGWRKINKRNLVILQDAFNQLEGYKSREDCKALLVDILNRAVETDLLNKNPAVAVKTRLVNNSKEEKRILTEEQTDILLECAKDSMMYPVFVVALGTGIPCSRRIASFQGLPDITNIVISVAEQRVIMTFAKICRDFISFFIQIYIFFHPPVIWQISEHYDPVTGT